MSNCPNPSCPNPSCQMTIQQCLDALEKMKRQMEVILPHLPEDVREYLATGRDPYADPPATDPNKPGVTKIIAAKQNADGSFTKMFAVKRDIPCKKDIPTSTSTPCDGNAMAQRQQNAVARPERDGTLARLRCQVENRLGHALPAWPHDENDPIGELEEMRGPQPQPQMKRTFALFSTVDEAEDFLMVTINLIVSMFSKIAETLKNDSINCLKDMPKDKCLKDMITEKCMALLLDLELAMTEPINKLKEEWVGRFKAVIPELDCALNNIIRFQALEVMNTRSIARQEAKIEAHIEASVANPSERRREEPAPSENPPPEIVVTPP